MRNMRNKGFFRGGEAARVLQRVASGWALGWCVFRVLSGAEVPVVGGWGEPSLVQITSLGTWGGIFLTCLRNITESERDQ